MIFGNKKEKILIYRIESGKSTNSQDSLFWSRFRKNRMAVWSLRVLWILVFFAVFSNFIANEKPLYCKLNGEHYFPVFKSIAIDFGLSDWDAVFQSTPWHDHQFESVIRTPIPWSGNTIDLKSGNYQSPLDTQKSEFRHWLGTTDLGRDVLAGMIEGARVALLVGLISMSLAALIGIILGAIAGYFGDSRLKISRGRLILNLIGVFLGIFYGFIVRSFNYSEGSFGIEFLKSLGIFTVTFILFNLLSILLKRNSFFRKQVTIPADLLIMRVIEIMNAMPGLLLLLAAVAIIKQPSIFYVMVIIGLIGWTSIARFIRAELLRIRNLSYIEAARAMGFSEFQILLKHAIPNALGPVLITLAFGIASAILLESTLSFLNIGVSDEDVSWGKLLSYARQREEAWWLAVFPGLAIFITVTIFNLIGEGLSDAFENRE
ncbi:MAG: ABC transporter permease [Saprospiraceae bacterium]|jgi:peptide/nickel transport system permease protein|nr:ABC transporter permease [Saprospiraceae bacterium]